MDKPITLSAAQKAAVRRYVERFRRYEEFRRALRFWPVSDVVQTADLLQRVMESIGRLGLIEDTAA